LTVESPSVKMVGSSPAARACGAIGARLISSMPTCVPVRFGSISMSMKPRPLT